MRFFTPTLRRLVVPSDVCLGRWHPQPRPLLLTVGFNLGRSRDGGRCTVVVLSSPYRAAERFGVRDDDVFPLLFGNTPILLLNYSIVHIFDFSPSLTTDNWSTRSESSEVPNHEYGCPVKWGNTDSTDGGPLSKHSCLRSCRSGMYCPRLSKHTVSVTRLVQCLQSRKVI